MPSLLAAVDLRVDVAGVPALDGLTFTTSGERVLVLGAARALFEAAAGLRPVERGSLVVEGLTPLDAVRAAAVAGAPLDPPMPPRWTLQQYVTWSARLTGRPRGDARDLAHGALERLALASSAGSRLGAASLAMRRATVVAAALATGAGVLLLEDPIAGLPHEIARGLARTLTRALAEVRSVVFAGRMPLESPLALAAEEALVVDRSHLAGQGAPAELAAASRTVALRVDGDVEAFAAAVAGLGARVTVAPSTARPVHVRVELGPSAARDVLRVAGEAGAVVMELRPIARAFA